jgi:hypothetical protein
MKIGDASGSLNKAGGVVVGLRKLAPGSGLNCGAGELLLIEMVRDQFDEGNVAPDKLTWFGSGLKFTGDSGGVFVLTA